jgi:hypothetical protein
MLAADFALGEVLWSMLVLFMWIIWFWLLIVIFSDLFRDHETSGAAKAGWTILLILLPYLGVLIYLIARGGGMAERQMKAQQQAKSEFDSYVRETAGGGGDRPRQAAPRQRGDQPGRVRPAQGQGPELSPP